MRVMAARLILCAGVGAVHVGNSAQFVSQSVPAVMYRTFLRR